MRVSRSMSTVAFILLTLTGPSTEGLAQGTSLGAIPQKNVNIIGPTPINWLYTGNPRMQQNEPDCAVSPGNPEWLFCGVNDYRGVNDPAIGDSFQGIAMSRDGGKTWISGLHPGHLGDSPNINKKFAADPNAEALPNLLLYNFIAGWRDDSFPGGIFVSRWYEHNREVGPPWEYLDTYEVATGTSGRFLDKPAFRTALFDPSLGRPPITVNIPAFDDPRNLANSHPAYQLQVPAARAHLCYAVFVGNDNNSGTKINCQYSDDGGVTWTVQKVSESVEINQGVSIATRNGGQEVLVVWRRFNDNNETSSIMYAHSTNFGDTFSKAEVLTEFCAFDQGTGPARFRTNALPVATSNGQDFAVYFTARNDATKTCFEPQKGNKKNAPLVFSLSDADPAFDFDSFEETRSGGARNRDGKIRSALNYARIFMVRDTGPGSVNWNSPPVMVDPQTVNGSDDPSAPRKPFHQIMPAASAAGGIETVAWYDSRFDKLINRFDPVTGVQKPLASGFVEDLVLNYIPASASDTGKAKGSLLPAGFYEIEPPPVPIADLPDPANNIPLRRNIDVMAAQFENGGFRNYFVDSDFYPVADGTAGGANSPSVRVTRFATRPRPGAPGEKQQLEFNYPNGRLFQKGKAPFIGDYNTVFAQPARQRDDLTWISNQSPPQAGELYNSSEPVFHVGWTSNRNVRGRVFYTGCDVWDETLQMWVASPGCDSTYNDPVEPPVRPANPAMMIPLQGEDGSNDGPPLSCVDTTGKARPLTRNQNVFVAAMKPGVEAEVVSAIKPRDGRFNTFVLALTNGTKKSRRLRLELPADTNVSFDRRSFVPSEGVAPLLDIEVVVPKGSGNARTIFDVANEAVDASYTPVVIVEVFDITDGQPGVLTARVPLKRDTLAPLENVQNNDPTGPLNIVDGSESYDVILNREVGKISSLDLENLDLENTIPMLDLENLDLENLDLENLDLENLDLENLDLENLDLENIVLFLNIANLDLENLDLENALYENLDLENLDLENLDLENLDLENLDLENRGLLFLDLENLDLENNVLQFLDLENLDLENLDLENLDLENLDLENLDLENLDLENLDLENDTIYASAIENLDLENLDLENTNPGDPYTEVSWTANSATNTMTGVDIKPLFSENLAQAIADTGDEDLDPNNDVPDSLVLLTVHKPYLTSTVQNNLERAGPIFFCTPQVVVENQLVYAALLTPDQINNIIADPDPTEASTPSFVLDPDATNIITLRLINPPPGFSSIQAASRNTGIALYTQPGDNAVCDEGSNSVSEVCEVDFVVDQDPPIITLLGDNPQTIEAGDPYVELDATATDVVDGDLTNEISIDVTAIDTSQPGSYSVIYTVADLSGNVDEKVRTVNVVDTTPPSITAPADILGFEATGAQTVVPLGTPTVSDLVGPVTFSNDAPATFPVGTTIVTWTASDGQVPANTATDTQTVTVVDTTPPSITAPADILGFEATGAQTVVPLGTPTVSDLVGPVTFSNDAPVTFPAGTTIVTWTASDGQVPANTATDSQSVNVVDTTPPTIIILPDNPATVEAGAEYLDAGAVATDLVDDDVILSASIVVNSTVNTAVVGDYQVTYDVTDSNNNAAAQAVRIVQVRDTTDPIITNPNPPEFNPEGPYVLQPGETQLPITWPISALDLENGLEITCTISGIELEPDSSSYNPDTGELTTVFSSNFTVGATTGFCTVTDAAGNFVTTPEFTVFVEDIPVSSPIEPVLNVSSDSGTTLTATLTNEDLASNVLATDAIDDAAGVPLDIQCTPTGDFAIGETDVTCLVTDSAGNSTDDTNPKTNAIFTVNVQYPFDVVFEKIKGNINAGSSLPIDFSYVDPATGLAVDSPGFMPSAQWIGPYTSASCSTFAPGETLIDDSDDAGSSNFRYSASQATWQYSWDTPMNGGFYYRFIVSPPGTNASSICVRLR